jgi:hypothetical protein
MLLTSKLEVRKILHPTTRMCHARVALACLRFGFVTKHCKAPVSGYGELSSGSSRGGGRVDGRRRRDVRREQRASWQYLGCPSRFACWGCGSSSSDRLAKLWRTWYAILARLLPGQLVFWAFSFSCQSTENTVGYFQFFLELVVL